MTAPVQHTGSSKEPKVVGTRRQEAMHPFLGAGRSIRSHLAKRYSRIHVFVYSTCRIYRGMYYCDITDSTNLIVSRSP